MFLTKIELDPSRRLARKYLGSPQVMHAVVLKATGGDESDGPGRVLWRVDQGHATALYVQSPQAPNCSQILEEAGRPGGQMQTLDYEPFLERLSEGQVWGFRLTANPSRAISQGPGMRGKRSGHVTVEQQRQWLITRASSLGFSLVPTGTDDDADSLLTVVRRGRPVFGRENPQQGRRDRVTINQTVYEGVLQVRDADALRHSLVAGIGRSKAYGCGLMTLARHRQE
ncbi:MULTISPECIES: type I-E CRISPR-associated protein Cas6/Cse3/CasE [Actinomyces]|uniref:Type I-E CRISPR-associated protein Cas6/Cse3/CasE n=1 Tax=Actinomyces respiraculi TaxID=2744574 RepID=A0A7T0LLE2_9ACTO|nr:MULTISPECIES: type I-E CRISPR-associated protein Cas6/Cse3/CasE [Actinomyces]QPL05914.1 type I-E CRISPR-associated protein Cas6/Cse3/CasE [Actinomyces respiraculi]